MSLSIPELLLQDDKPITIAMNDDRALNDILCRSFVAISLVVGGTSFFDELIQDVFDLLARGRRRFKLVENSVKIGATIGRFLDVLNEIFGTRISRRRLRDPRDLPLRFIHSVCLKMRALISVRRFW